MLSPMAEHCFQLKIFYDVPNFFNVWYPELIVLVQKMYAQLKTT